MQLTDKDGNIFGTGGLEITTSSGKPKVPVINTDITIGTTAVIGGVSGRVLYNNAGVVGELDLSSIYVPTSRTLTINGVTQDLSANRTFTISTGITIGSTAIASGVVGRVLFEGAGNVVQESANLFWDNTNNRLSVGTSTQAYTLAVGGKLRVSAYAYWVDSGANALQVDGTSSFSDNIIIASGKPLQFGTSATQIAGTTAGPMTFRAGSGSTQMSLFSTGNLCINTTTDAGFRFDVAGTARVQNTLSILNPSFTSGGSITHSANATLVITGGPGGGTENITFGPSNRIFINATQSRFPNGSVQIASTLSVGVANATSQNMIWATGGITASSAIARGIYTDTTLTASANNDFLVGLDVQPTFTNGAFTGVTNLALRTTGQVRLNANGEISSFQGYGSDIFRVHSNANGLLEIGQNLVTPIGSPSAKATIYNRNNTYFAISINVPASQLGKGAQIAWNNQGQGGGTIYHSNEVLYDMGMVNANSHYLHMFASGNVLLTNGTRTDAGYKLDVNGTARINNIFYVTNSSFTGNIRIESIGNNQQRIVGAYGENITFGAGGNTININATETYVSGSFLGSGFWMQNNGATVLGAQAMAASSALLDIRSTTRGFLPPRMTNAQMLAISTPATGLMVYDTTNNKLCCYDGTTWQNLF